MSEYEVVIPENSFSTTKFKQGDLPGVAVINLALKNFEPKVVFSWHLSLIIDCEDSDAQGMPTRKEESVLEPFEQELNTMMQGIDSEKPNSLFLGRVTWNKTRELIWRVFDPALVNNTLQEIVSRNNFQRALDYKMERDPEWKQAEWHLSPK